MLPGTRNMQHYVFWLKHDYSCQHISVHLLFFCVRSRISVGGSLKKKVPGQCKDLNAKSTMPVLINMFTNCFCHHQHIIIIKCPSCWYCKICFFVVMCLGGLSVEETLKTTDPVGTVKASVGIAAGFWWYTANSSFRNLVRLWVIPFKENHTQNLAAKSHFHFCCWPWITHFT